MVNRNTPISAVDLNALATLANTKLSPATPYAFPSFAGKDKIGLPTNVTNKVTYDGTGQFPPNGKITFNLFGYKTIGGTKYYSWIPLSQAFYPEAGHYFSMKWDWVSVTGPTAPDGYIVDLALPGGEGLIHVWKDVGNVQTLSEDGSLTGWNNDNSYRDLGDALNLPCGHAIWIKILNRIHSDLLSKFDLYGGAVAFGDTHKVSGPWAVSVGQKCYLNLNNKPAYKDLKFIYSEADSATGYLLSNEADMFDWYFGASNGNNNISFGITGKINGKITLFSAPSGQNASDWTLSATPSTGITITFQPIYIDLDRVRTVTAMVFEFTDVPYTGTPIVLTATPTGGGNIINDGTGGRLDMVFTSDPFDYAFDDTLAIHPAGPVAKSVPLTNTLAKIRFTPPIGGFTDFEAHWRSFVNGVFMANTLPTLGVMSFVDQDLPNYLIPTSGVQSSRRVPINQDLDYIGMVNNRGALWGVFRDTDFVPDFTLGKPIYGSKVWQDGYFTKYVSTSVQNNTVPPSGVDQTLYNFLTAFFASVAVKEIRMLFLAPPDCSLYIKNGDLPTVSDYDYVVPAGSWFTFPPGFATDTTYWYSFLNGGNTDATVESALLLITSDKQPFADFFPVDDDGNQQLQTVNYHFGDGTNHALIPIPPQGYNVWRISVRRLPEPNSDGVSTAPTTGTADLPVKIGIMKDFGFDQAGTFTEIETITIPAGQAFKTVELSLPVLAGAPLAYQCTEEVVIRADVNFQPIMHSLLDSTTQRFNGQPWYDRNKALLFYQDIDPTITILPLTAEIYNDLENLLNTLP